MKRMLASKMRNSRNIQHCFGIRDGIEEALVSLLGSDVPVKVPAIERNYFEGDIPDDIREWALEWLGAIADQRAEEDEGLAGSFYESLIEQGVE